MENPTSEPAQTFEEHREEVDKALAQVVNYINTNINMRFNRLEGNILQLKK